MQLRGCNLASTRAARVVALFVLVLVPGWLMAQTNSGALDLLKPIGARATAMGSAYVAEQGSDAIWWNPAGIAGIKHPEFAFDHFEDVFTTSGDAVSLILPAGAAGVFGIAARLFNYGTFTNTDSTGQDIGSATTTSISLGATYAASFGQRLNAGISLRMYQYSLGCSGLCSDVFASSPYTGFIDVGLQFRPQLSGPFEIGLLLSNAGPNLQVHDKPQSDALPARVRVGVSYRPTSAGWDPALRLAGTAEVVSSLAFSSQEMHVGAEVGYASGATLLLARAGYVLQVQGTGDGRTSGPSFGVGIASGRVKIDFARVLETVSTGLGVPPTYISIRLGL